MSPGVKTWIEIGWIISVWFNVQEDFELAVIAKSIFVTTISTERKIVFIFYLLFPHIYNL